jgi:hypothetical protein
MPICDQMIIAVTIRSGWIASSSTPIDPVLPRPMPAPVTMSARIQSTTAVVTPASVSPAVTSATETSTSTRGGSRAAAAAVPATSSDTHAYATPISAWLRRSARCRGSTPSTIPSPRTVKRIAALATQNPGDRRTLWSAANARFRNGLRMKATGTSAATMISP